jgi:hypothetical protein
VRNIAPSLGEEPATLEHALEHALERTHEHAFPYVDVTRKSQELDTNQRKRGSVVEFRNVEDPGRGSAPPQHVREGNEGNNERMPKKAYGKRRGTGTPKSPELRAIIGDLRNIDLLGALRAIDGGDAARRVWMHCTAEHAQVVHLVLAELIDQWATVNNPAGWVMKRLIKLFQQDKREAGRTSTGLGRGGAPTGVRKQA